ncbi:serine hydroxymethyltransferase [Mycoplasmopsis pullorum]|uniref:serine hydroxymethyltransferase n=1 Tax=Mycoplasmopsis pullorum TaxID=48003 RepID=UPI00111B5E3E|nr:serine hydroxymethyltransferase [Mycoplasmopsis pullorum]TNK81734.1 serine hydroxymethyltransferase [Mycoplasmopsis pullorum]TNK83135.1 serine hydroxymethyltransferase [Mycoplasmopsis pullorum]TNK84752.1 serine hydroxymethyltransferase [Mycoplasmopsis pullorum]TNK85413.1 serine hydroxymethyltransferase [Mycoplasmopsis pullorum]TNK86031.1 serine hydroxymethyltransferase [Mycoplasmopsis pullorum]
MYQKVKLNDKLIESAINNELQRQKDHIELIASENYTSEDVLIAQGSVLTNKYGEGYPGKRYYGSCEYVDVVENAAIDRLKELFGIKYANVQPYSGSVANAAAIASVVPSGGKIMGLSLNCGGHLTHGYKISFSGIFYNSVSYELNQEGHLDYEAIEELALKEKPDLIICGYSAYSRFIDFARFRAIADKVGAKLLADIAHIAGLIAAGVHPSPAGYADVITTTTHKTLRGARGAVIMTNDEEIAKKVNRWVFPGYQGGPLFHAIAGKAIAFYEALTPMFKQYGASIVANAHTFCERFKELGATIVSGGTDNHLFLIDVWKTYGINGKQAEVILEELNITTNKNTIPFDTLSPTLGSGLRLGSAAMTSRDFNKWVELADLIHYVLKNYDFLSSDDENAQAKKKELRAQVLDWTREFPIKKSYL